MSRGPADPAALQAKINGLINSLFAPKDQGGLQKEFARIKNAVARGDSAEAQSGIVAFVGRLLEARDEDALQDPNGPAPPQISEALLDLVNSVAEFGGAPPPIPLSNPFAGDGAVEVVGPAGGTVVTSTGFGGVGFPPGALPEDVIVVVARLPNPAVPGAGPLPTTLTQYPLFYDFSTSPHVPQFGADVTVGICQLEVGEPFGPPTQAVADRLQLAHPDPANTGQIELLERTLASFVNCDGVTLARGREAPAETLFGRAVELASTGGSRLLDLLRPGRAWAVHGGLGGRTRSFSPFAAVDPGLSIVGVCASPMTGVDATYPTVDQAIASAAPGGIVKLCPQTINVAAEYLVDKPITIEAEIPASPPQFLVNGATTPVAFRVNPTLQGAVTFRSLSFTHTGFAVAIELGLGQGNPGSWWQVVVENSQFVLPPGQGRAIRMFVTSATNPKVTVINNSISGGGFGIVTLTGSSTIEIRDNQFTGGFGEALRIQNEPNVVVEGNSFTSALPGTGIYLLRVGDALVENNNFQGQSFYPIRIHGFPDSSTTATVRGNVITGPAIGGPPEEPGSYFTETGILIGTEGLTSTGLSLGAYQVTDNQVSGAKAGIRVVGGGSVVAGTDNIISSVHTGLQLINTSTAASSLAITGSDFSAYVPVSLTGPSVPPSTITATCNWWNDPEGPQNIAPGTPVSSLSPYATGPVANGGPGQCNGILPQWIQVGAGTFYTCALSDNGAAYCWGANAQGQLGDGTTSPRSVPAPVAGGHSFTAISVGDATACGLAASGDLYCWGLNQFGELGAGLPTGAGQFSTVPVLVSGGHTWSSEFQVGLRHACARATDQFVYCWGRNVEGQLGVGTIGGDSNVPLALSQGLLKPSAGWQSSCAIINNGALFCWGISNLLGNGPASGFSPIPTGAATGSLFQSMDVGALYVCGITTGGSAVCWGGVGLGEGGNGTTTSTSVPAPVVGGHAFRSVDANSNNTFLAHTCGVTQTDQAYCWGANNFQQLGAAAGTTCTWAGNNYDCAPSPVAVGGGIAFDRVAVGNGHTCGLGLDRAVYCWGRNNAAQLGDGTIVNHPLPVRVRNPVIP